MVPPISHSCRVFWRTGSCCKPFILSHSPATTKANNHSRPPPDGRAVTQTHKRPANAAREAVSQDRSYTAEPAGASHLLILSIRGGLGCHWFVSPHSAVCWLKPIRVQRGASYCSWKRELTDDAQAKIVLPFTCSSLVNVKVSSRF